MAPFAAASNLDLLSFMRRLLSLSLYALLSLPWAIAPARAEEKALYLKQAAVSVGATESYLTSQGIRINLGNDKIYLVAKAPAWRVVLFNSITKKGLEMPYAKWISHHPAWNHGKADDWVPSVHLLKVASRTIDGRHCTDYVLAKLMPNGRLLAKRGGTAGHLIVTQVSGVAPQAIHILQRTLDLPQTADLPLRLTLAGKKRKVEGLKFKIGGESHLLSTTTIKTVVLPDSLVTYPKDFKTVPLEFEVLYDSKALNSSVEQFLDAFK